MNSGTSSMEMMQSTLGWRRPWNRFETPFPTEQPNGLDSNSVDSPQIPVGLEESQPGTKEAESPLPVGIGCQSTPCCCASPRHKPQVEADALQAFSEMERVKFPFPAKQYSVLGQPSSHTNLVEVPQADVNAIQPESEAASSANITAGDVLAPQPITFVHPLEIGRHSEFSRESQA